ncbi:MAG: radical SAM protein, partial [Nitrospinota bacterium]|nr:radical SAM protein [Nitrospinota bacterium]
VTSRCQLRCAHCYQEDHGGEGELPLEGLLGILDQYRQLRMEWNRDHGHDARGHVTVTGGEPFARSDIWALLERLSACRNEFGFAILTNGECVDAAMARRLKKLGAAFVQVSVEGSRETHDSIRGEGSLGRVERGLKHLIADGVNTMVSFTAGAGNYLQFPEVVEFGARLGVGRVWTDRLIPCGSGASLETMNIKQTEEYLNIVAGQAGRRRGLLSKGTEVAAHRALQFITAGGRPYRCNAGDGLITIMPDGALYPCRRMPAEAGNVTKALLRDLYYQDGLMAKLRDPDNIPQACQGCIYKRFCGGGLRCLSFAECQDPFKADPGCPLANKEEQAYMKMAL